MCFKKYQGVMNFIQGIVDTPTFSDNKSLELHTKNMIQCVKIIHDVKRRVLTDRL